MPLVSFDIPGANTSLTLDEAQQLFVRTSIGHRLIAGATITASKEEGSELLDAIASEAHPSDAVGHLRAALMEYVHGPGAV